MHDDIINKKFPLNIQPSFCQSISYSLFLPPNPKKSSSHHKNELTLTRILNNENVPLDNRKCKQKTFLYFLYSTTHMHKKHLSKVISFLRRHWVNKWKCIWTNKRESEEKDEKIWQALMLTAWKKIQLLYLIGMKLARHLFRLTR